MFPQDRRSIFQDLRLPPHHQYRRYWLPEFDSIEEILSSVILVCISFYPDIIYYYKESIPNIKAT